MASEARTSAKARIAASAPKNTYGKHKNKLLPLTGSQFLRSDGFGTTNGTVVAKDTPSRIDQESSPDDSPLSDAEIIHKVQQQKSAVARMRRTSALAKSTSTVKQTRRENGGVHATHPDIGQEDNLSLSKLHHRNKPAVDRQKPRSAANSAQKKGKLKPTGVVRSRLPLNELLLVSGATGEDPFEKSTKTHGILVRDPISSSAQPLLDAVDSSNSEATPTKRKAKVSLSVIRKRIRTPSTGHKSLENFRTKYNAAQITPTGSQPKQIVGDGFERSELTSSHPSRYAIKHARRQREPLLVGLQALSLISGPLPEVDFTRETSATQLELKRHEPSDSAGVTFGRDTPLTFAALLDESRLPLNRRVSFNHDVDRVISAQLASISAPRREPSIALDSDDENEDPDDDEDDEEGDDGGDEDENDDDEAADTYLDQDKLLPEGHHDSVAESTLEVQSLLSEAIQNPGPAAHALIHRPQGGFRPTSLVPNGFGVGNNRLRISSLRRRTFSGKPLPNEVNEPIDDDFRVDDMLLGDEESHDSSANHSSHDHRSTNDIHSTTDLAGKEEFARSSSRLQTAFGRTSSMQPRSILKNNTPYISSDSNRPESTAANTRRNSMVDIEESRYFSAARDQLDLTPPKQTITRMKSSSRFFNPIEVPYSDEIVRETSPERPNYTDTSQLRSLKRTNDAFWTSSAALVPQTDLRSLTRSVSEVNGTLSQSVRRRSSLKFQSPLKVAGQG